jgi:hypothetical protein
MDITKLPETLTYNQVKALRAAFGHFYDQESGAKFVDAKTGFHFDNVTGFVDYLYSPEIGIPKGTSVKHIGIVLESWYETLSKAPEFTEPTMTPAPEYAVSSNTLTPQQLEQFAKEDEAKKVLQQKADDDAKIQVETAIKKQQEIYSQEIQKAKELEKFLENQNIYYKVEKVPSEKTPEAKNLEEQARVDPKKFIEDAADQIKNNPVFKNLAANEAQIVSKQVAISTYETLTGNSPVVQAALINKIISEPKLLNKIFPIIGHQNVLKNLASNIVEQKTVQFELEKQFIDISKIDEYKNIEDVKIEFSTVPQEGFKEFDFNQQIVSPSIENLNQESLLLNDLKGLGKGEIKSRVLLDIGNRLETYVAKLPTNSLLAKTYNSEIVQLGMSSLGVVKAVPWVAVEGSFLGKIIIGSGFGKVAGFIQTKTGINLGIKIATKEAVKTTTKAGVATVAKTGLKALFSKITAALGSAAGPIGTILAWLGGELLVKIAEKIPWKKILPFLVGGAAFLIAGPVIGVVVGVGTLALVSGGIRAVTLAGIGSGIAGFFGALGGAFLGAIGMPILITLLVFPVVVALILFIINSGAYLVPPTGSLIGLENPYIEIEKKVTPEGPFNNSDIPSKTKIEYTVTVSAKKGLLTNITFKDECKVIKNGTPPACPNPSQETPQAPDSISPSAPFVFNYTLNFTSHNYDDSAIVNTFTVTADTVEQKGVTVANSASIIIGKPPMECPSNSWPLAGDVGIDLVIQGPSAPLCTHKNDPYAIDISVNGATVIAAHSGIVTIGQEPCGSKYVQIASSCGGTSFYSYYGHLGAVMVSSGQQITMGQAIAISDNSGAGVCSSGPHLHFAFYGTTNGVPKVQKPYLKRNVPIGCCGTGACN